MLKWTSSFVNDFNFECYQKKSKSDESTVLEIYFQFSGARIQELARGGAQTS